jgi:hypothetical protein
MIDGLLNKKGTDPKTQDTFDAFMSNGINIIHNEKVSDGMIQNILNADDPVKEIANATLNVVNRLEQSGSENGMNFGPEILSNGANILMGEIIQVAEISGLKPLTEEEKYMAYSLTVSRYIDEAIKSGKITPEQLQEMSQQAQQTPEGQKIVAETQNMMQSQTPPVVGRA